MQKNIEPPSACELVEVQPFTQSLLKGAAEDHGMEPAQLPAAAVDFVTRGMTHGTLRLDRDTGSVIDRRKIEAEEVAFYDALAENGSATELMGNADLRLIASELVKAVRATPASLNR